MANLDTAVKRHAGLTLNQQLAPRPSGSDANTTTERAHLVGRYGAFAFASPSGQHMVLVLYDKVVVGTPITPVVQFKSGSGTAVSPDATPTIRIYSVSALGAETDEVAIQAMTLGATTGTYYVSWTPSAIRTYVVLAMGVRGSESFFESKIVASDLSPIAVEIIGNELN